MLRAAIVEIESMVALVKVHCPNEAIAKLSSGKCKSKDSAPKSGRSLFVG